MNSLDISLDKNSYQIFIKQNIFKSITDYITDLGDYNKVFIITQKSITDIYHPHFLCSESNILFIEENESGKTFNQASNIIDELIEKGCNKDSIIIGLGGGVVTDFTGFVASIFVLSFLWLGAQFNSIPNSIVDDFTYNTVFQNAWRLITASMVAYLFAQFIDVRVFHFWKKLTNGKHLWLRNNGSTIASQLIDTTLVIFILFVGVWDTNQILSAIIDGWIFKMLMALLDTPIIYAIIYFLKRKIDIAPYQ